MVGLRACAKRETRREIEGRHGVKFSGSKYLLSPGVQSNGRGAEGRKDLAQWVRRGGEVGCERRGVTVRAGPSVPGL